MENCKGYEREHWLDVEWLCGPCHKKADRVQAEPKNYANLR